MPTATLTPAHREVERHVVEALGIQDWRVLKRETRTLVGTGTLGGAEVVVKWWSGTGLGAGLKRLLGLGRADRHTRGAALLRAAGIRAPRTLATNELLVGPGRGQVLVMERLAGRTLLHHLRDGEPSVRREHVLARAVGDVLARMALAGLSNRDGKPSNIIVLSLSDRAAELAVIDTGAIARHRLLPPPTLRPLVNLLLEPLGCGCAPRRALRMRTYLTAAGAGGNRPGREDRRQDWLKIEYLVAVHGDPRPRVDPLAEPA